MKTLFLLLQLLQLLLHDLQPPLVLGLYPARLLQGLLPFLVLLGRELQGRAAEEAGDRDPRCPGAGLLCAPPAPLPGQRWDSALKEGCETPAVNCSADASLTLVVLLICSSCCWMRSVALSTFSFSSLSSCQDLSSSSLSLTSCSSLVFSSWLQIFSSACS